MLTGQAASGVHGQVYVHRESIPLSLLRDGLEKLTYPEVAKALGELREELEKLRSGKVMKVLA